jgi:hypothetical protein
MKFRFVVAFAVSTMITGALLAEPAARAQTAPRLPAPARIVPAQPPSVQTPPADTAAVPIAPAQKPPYPITSLLFTVVPLATTITGAAAGATVGEWLLAMIAPASEAAVAPAASVWVWSAYLTAQAATGVMIGAAMGYGAALGYIGGRMIAAQTDASR